jgi:hypothetical protein
MKLKGHLQISHYFGTDIFRIEVEDDSSGIKFLEVELDAKTLMLALTAQYSECEFELRGVEHVGKTRETKKVVVALEQDVRYDTTDEEKRALLAPYEVDGWIGHARDLGNHHNLCRVNNDKGTVAYEVGFHRFVDKSMEELK